MNPEQWLEFISLPWGCPCCYLQALKVQVGSHAHLLFTWVLGMQTSVLLHAEYVASAVANDPSSLSLLVGFDE